MGLSPKVFGPVVLRVLHLFSLMVPPDPTPDDRDNFTQFVLALVNILPCAACMHHATVYVAEHPVMVGNRLEAVAWVNDFHNSINKRHGKREYTPS